MPTGHWSSGDTLQATSHIPYQRVILSRSSLEGRCDCSQRRMNHILTAMPSCTSERLDVQPRCSPWIICQVLGSVTCRGHWHYHPKQCTVRYKSLQIAINLPCLIPPSGKLMEISWPLTRPIPKTIPCLLPLPSASTNCHHCIPCHAIRRHFPCNGGGLTFETEMQNILSEWGNGGGYFGSTHPGCELPRYHQDLFRNPGLE